MQFLTLWSFIMRLQHSVTSSAPLLVLSLFPPPLQLLPPLKFWTPQSYSWRLESSSPKLLLMLIFWPLSFNHKCSSVQLLSRIWLFATEWTIAHPASLSITNSQGLLKLTSIESVMPFKTISSSVILLSSCLQYFPASVSFQMSHFFTSGCQSIGVSASTSVLPMNIQDWFPLEWTGWISLSSRDSQESSPTPQFKSINSFPLSFLYSPNVPVASRMLNTFQTFTLFCLDPSEQSLSLEMRVLQNVFL